MQRRGYVLAGGRSLAVGRLYPVPVGGARLQARQIHGVQHSGRTGALIDVGGVGARLARQTVVESRLSD